MDERVTVRDRTLTRSCRAGQFSPVIIWIHLRPFRRQHPADPPLPTTTLVPVRADGPAALHRVWVPTDWAPRPAVGTLAG
jgi:hypothetical protein